MADIDIAKRVAQFMTSVVFSHDVELMMIQDGAFRAFMTITLSRFQWGDYGDLDNYPEDVEAQEAVLETIAGGDTGTLYGFYDYEGQRINVIQEVYSAELFAPDGKIITTVCLPHER